MQEAQELMEGRQVPVQAVGHDRDVQEVAKAMPEGMYVLCHITIVFRIVGRMKRDPSYRLAYDFTSVGPCIRWMYGVKVPSGANWGREPRALHLGELHGPRK